MQFLLWPLVSWLIRSVVVKFIVLGALFFAIEALMPRLIAQLVAWSPSSLTSAFSGVAPGVWWFLDKFALDLGIPLALSAHATAFAIRRIPVIG